MRIHTETDRVRLTRGAFSLPIEIYSTRTMAEMTAPPLAPRKCAIEQDFPLLLLPLLLLGYPSLWLLGSIVSLMPPLARSQLGGTLPPQ